MLQHAAKTDKAFLIIFHFPEKQLNLLDMHENCAYRMA